MADSNENSMTVVDEVESERQVKKQKTDCYEEGVLLGYGNPLLDIQINGDKAFLEKYGLEANNAILAEDKHKPMYNEMTEKPDVEYVPGGATLNAIKVAQWLIGVKDATTFFGCINKVDKFGKELEKIAREMGVNVKFQYTEKESTGTCGVIVTGDNRSLCANLAAANLFTEEHLNDADNWALVEKADFFYCAGFPLTVSPPSMERLAKHSHEKGKTFCMNLSAPFLCMVFKDPMLKLLPYVDILFGNESEAAEFSKHNDLGTEDVSEIALKIAAMPKENKEKSRMVVFTQGDQPVIVAQDGKVTTYPIIPIKPEEMTDTNGAGDAFVGGFLAQLIKRESTEKCVQCGNYAANLVIQRSGCTVPEKPNFS